MIIRCVPATLKRLPELGKIDVFSYVDKERMCRRLRAVQVELARVSSTATLKLERQERSEVCEQDRLSSQRRFSFSQRRSF